MTSVMALPRPVEPSALSLPEGQVSPEAFALPEPELSEPGAAAAPPGSEPHATRLSEAMAARAANVVFRTRREVIIRVLHRQGGGLQGAVSAPRRQPAPRRLMRKLRTSVVRMDPPG